MKNDEHHNDASLAALFEQLHRDDAPPPFARLYRGEDSRGVRRRPLWAGLATATAFVAIAAIAIPQCFPRHSSLLETEWTTASSDWEAPTDFLLETPGMQVLTTTPSLGSDAVTSWPGEEETKL